MTDLLQHPLSENWATLWEALAAAQPDRVAVVLGDLEIKWGDLDRRAAQLAAALTAAGVGPDAKVAQMMYNCPEYLESAYASFKVRASTVNINYRYKANEIAHVVNDSNAAALFFHSSFASVVAQALPLMPSISLLVQVDDGAETSLLEGAAAYDSLIESYAPMSPIDRDGGDQLLLYTGGTTGMPKGVVWTHRGLFGAMAFTGYTSLNIPLPTTVQQVTEIAVGLAESGASPTNMTAPPLMHGTALFLAFSTFVLGGKVVMLGGRKFDPSELLTLVQRERVTQLSIVGDAFARPIVAELEKAELAGVPYDLSSVRRVVSTGATFSASLKRSFMDRMPQAAIIDMIGASEGGPFALAITAPGQVPPETAEFFATPSTVIFDDQTWTPIAPGQNKPGVLAVSGPMPEGYFGDPSKTESTFRTIGGTRYSIPGDYATIDADGRVHLLGRGSVCINTGGEKVYPEEVEVAARSHSAVQDCTVVGVDDDRFGQRIVLVASRIPASGVDCFDAAVSDSSDGVGSSDAAVSDGSAAAVSDGQLADDIIAHVKSLLATYKAPRQVVFVDMVYRSPSGKADYRWAKDVAQKSADAAVSQGDAGPVA